MDSSAPVIDIQQAKAVAMAPSRPAIKYRSKHTILELLEMYEAGRSYLTAKSYLRWQQTFAVGVASGGIYYGELEGNGGLLSVFWRTDNPVVNLAHGIPVPKQDGNYAYVCWLWNSFGRRGLLSLKAHIFRALPGVRYIAHHDQRSKVKTKRSDVERYRGSGRLIVHPLNGPDIGGVEKMLAERNGHGR